MVGQGHTERSKFNVNILYMRPNLNCLKLAQENKYINISDNLQRKDI